VNDEPTIPHPDLAIKPFITGAGPVCGHRSTGIGGSSRRHL